MLNSQIIHYFTRASASVNNILFKYDDINTENITKSNTKRP